MVHYFFVYYFEYDKGVKDEVIISLDFLIIQIPKFSSSNFSFPTNCFEKKYQGINSEMEIKTENRINLNLEC